MSKASHLSDSGEGRQVNWRAWWGLWERSLYTAAPCRIKLRIATNGNTVGDAYCNSRIAQQRLITAEPSLQPSKDSSRYAHTVDILDDANLHALRLKYCSFSVRTESLSAFLKDLRDLNFGGVRLVQAGLAFTVWERRMTLLYRSCCNSLSTGIEGAIYIASHSCLAVRGLSVHPITTGHPHIPLSTWAPAPNSDLVLPLKQKLCTWWIIFLFFLHPLSSYWQGFSSLSFSLKL